MIDQVYPSQLPQWWQAHADAGLKPVLLDVREAMELRAAAVQPAGADVLTWPMHTLPARLHELPRNAAIACLCHHGGRSMQVAAFLAHHGFDAVCNVAGGIDAWSVQVDPAVPRY